MDKSKNFEKVEAFFEGQLSDAEKIVFQKELEQDPELQEALKKYELAKEALAVLSDDALKAKFQSWRQEAPELSLDDKSKLIEMERPRGLLKNRPFILRIAAAVAIILIIAIPSIYYFGNFGQTDHFAALSEPLEVEWTRSGASEEWILGMEAYQDREYENAIDLLEKIMPASDKLNFYLGHSYYLSENYLEAANRFQIVVEKGESAYLDEAEWALLASWYHLPEKKDAFNTLLDDILSGENHLYKEEAGKLKENLDSD